MFSGLICVFSPVFLIILSSVNCELPTTHPPELVLYSQGDPDYTEVLVKRENDELKLVCELHGDKKTHRYVWNFLPDQENTSDPAQKQLNISLTSLNSKLTVSALSLNNSGLYVCSSPPFSVSKHVVVQVKGQIPCARGAFSCGLRCVLPSHVCDGHADCMKGEDEDPLMCGTDSPCAAPDKLNCSSGRCIPEAVCCKPYRPLCKQPACCDEQSAYNREGYIDLEYPALYEDKHSPEDYGFIQSTIYTVTACALIFMIAIVLLVSAICKMHLKRAALQTHAQRRFTMQATRLPPCYESSGLLSESRPLNTSPAISYRVVNGPHVTDRVNNDHHAQTNGISIARLSNIFNTRYRQVPTQPRDVELQSVHNSPQNSPNHTIPEYRSPTLCDLDFLPDESQHVRDLNLPMEYYQRRLLNLDLERPRPLTLSLGRFQLNIPRFSRRNDRPDTPITDLNIDYLRYNDTYTLNGRTIRLLGANFENYPNNTPPSYSEAVTKNYGPPPMYLGGGNTEGSNVEMPPDYDELAVNAGAGHSRNEIVENNGNVLSTANNGIGTGNTVVNTVNNGIGTGNVATNAENNGNATNNANSSTNSANIGTLTNNNDTCIPVGDSATGTENVSVNSISDTTNSIDLDNRKDNNNYTTNNTLNDSNGNLAVTNTVSEVPEFCNGNDITGTENSISEIIDNLPAIDSDDRYVV